MFNFVFAELVFVAVMTTVVIVTWPRVPWTFVQYGSIALIIAAPNVLFPFSRTLWLAVDLLMRPAPHDHKG
jgi:hypothetical protein